MNARNRADGEHTQLLVFFNGLLLSDLEALGLGGSEIIVVVVGHCACCWLSSWVGIGMRRAIQDRLAPAFQALDIWIGYNITTTYYMNNQLMEKKERKERKGKKSMSNRGVCLVG